MNVRKQAGHAGLNESQSQARVFDSVTLTGGGQGGTGSNEVMSVCVWCVYAEAQGCIRTG